MRLRQGKSRFDPATIDALIVRLGLEIIAASKSMYRGTCPLCGAAHKFIVWADRGKFRCYHCGCDGLYVHSPERLAEEKSRQRAALEEMVC